MDALREFLRSYEEEYTRKLKTLVDRYVENDEEILKVADTFYNQLFKEKIHKDFFYNLALSYALRGKNIKPVISSILLTILRDFLDYLLKTKEELNRSDVDILKKLFNTIEEVLEAVEKAYTEYFETINKELKKVKQMEEKERKFLLKEVELIKLKEESVLFVFSYKELPIYCKGKIKDLDDDIVEIEFTERCLALPILNIGDFFHAKSENLTNPVKFEVMKRNEKTILARAVSYEEAFIEKRQHVRVQPEKPIPVYILEKNIVGKMVDISVGGIGIFLQAKVVEPDEIVILEFHIKDKDIKVKGECRYIVAYDHGYRAGFKFVDLSPQHESLIGQYVMERQFQILKELKALAS